MIRTLLTALTLTLAASSPTWADPWQARLSVYYWKTGLALDSSFGGDPVDDYDGPFSEFSWFALPLQGELRNGRHSLRGEFIGLSISDAAGPYFGVLNPDMRLYGNMSALSYGYAVYENQASRFEVTGGARHWNANFEIDLGVLGSHDTTERVTSPFLGFYAETQLSTRWQLNALASYGGFGSGLESETDVQLRARYNLTRGLWVNLGYRHLQVSFDNPELQSLAIFGPTLGLEYQF